MIIFIALLAFALPLLLRNYLELLQGLMAIIWIILVTKMPQTFPTSSFEYKMHRIIFIALPVWVFGSFIALSIRSESAEEIISEHQNKMDDLIIDYETSKAEENECPICFSKRHKDQSKCTNCGHTY